MKQQIVLGWVLAAAAVPAFAAGNEKLTYGLESDADGTELLSPERAERTTGAEDLSMAFSDIDVNNDGVISADEAAAADLGFSAMDNDSDGTISQEEFRLSAHSVRESVVEQPAGGGTAGGAGLTGDGEPVGEGVSGTDGERPEGGTSATGPGVSGDSGTAGEGGASNGGAAASGAGGGASG